LRTNTVFLSLHTLRDTAHCKGKESPAFYGVVTEVQILSTWRPQGIEEANKCGQHGQVKDCRPGMSRVSLGPQMELVEVGEANWQLGRPERRPALLRDPGFWKRMSGLGLEPCGRF
jgi:hypothetical protein